MLSQINCITYWLEQIIIVVWAILKFFKMLSSWWEELRKELVKLAIRQGLVSIGKTRFSTLGWAGMSIERCLPAIQCLAKSNLEITGIEDMKILKNVSHPTKAMEFQILLNRFVGCVRPFALALKCQESAHLTLADVFLYWVSSAAALNEFLSNDDGIPPTVKAKVWQITNTRFTLMLHKAPSDAYFVTYWLHPGNLIQLSIRCFDFWLDF